MYSLNHIAGKHTFIHEKKNVLNYSEKKTGAHKRTCICVWLSRREYYYKILYIEESCFRTFYKLVKHTTKPAICYLELDTVVDNKKKKKVYKILL